MWQIYGLMARELIHTRRREAAAERRARSASRGEPREETASRLRSRVMTRPHRA